VVPVAQEYAGLTSVQFGLFYEPYNESLTVIVMYTTVAFKSEVYVRETRYFLKKHLNILPFLLYDWFVFSHINFLVIDFLKIF